MNIILAYGTTFLILLSSSIYPLRKLTKHFNLLTEYGLYKIYYSLRRHHNILGIVSIFATFLHCRFSYSITKQHSLLGSFLLIVLIMIVLTFYLKKRFLRRWLLMHKVLSIVLILGIIVHVFIEFNI